MGVNSDDPAVFATSITDEYALCASDKASSSLSSSSSSSSSPSSSPANDGFGVSGGGGAVGSAGTGCGAGGMGGVGLGPATLRRCTLSAIEAAFVGEPEKARLRRLVQERYHAFAVAAAAR